ncbi:5066_t:CDS:2 [Acaulospora morrowiae]|uniref:5066_t:CDS:1 n=1 Tax=Acaulospora morrowiae TaxID=94023 RepID=A0A9N9GU57_9GLOM|nr:5066_t:CDS:2 [Acaulospora morrowiae]
MGLVCCRPSQPPTSQTSTLTTVSPLTSSHSTPTPTPYVIQRPSSQVTSQKTAKCPECHQLTSTLYWGWCQHCSARHFSANFTNWSSGNLSLDKLIQEIQLNATYSKHPVALKRLKGSEECPEDFLNEIKSFHSITLQELSFEVTRCFGISQDPTTKEYIMVTSYAENGSLHHYLQLNPHIDWSTRICFLLKIVQGLHVIHSAGLTHRNFHSGNILVGKRYPTVSDFGLNGYIGKHVGNTSNTVLPEDSPDVFNDGDNSNGSTISLLNSNRPSIRDVQHPKCWIQLMRRCWNDDPAQRPTTVEIKEVLEKWYQLIETNVTKNREDLDILRDFRDAESVILQENRNSNGGLSVNSGKLVNNISLLETRKKHPEAHYYSRKIPTMKLVKRLEEKMKPQEVRDYVNLRYLQIDPSAYSSRNNSMKSSPTTMATATQTINNQLLNPYRKWSSTWDNVMEDRDDRKSYTEMVDTDNRSNLSKGDDNDNVLLKYRGGVVGGVVEILRNSFEIEESNQNDDDIVGDANDDITPISIFWKANSEDRILEDGKKKVTNDLPINVGLEGDHRPKNGGDVPVNNSDSLILENGNLISTSNIIDATRNLSFNDINSVSDATSKPSQNHTSISYF